MSSGCGCVGVGEGVGSDGVGGIPAVFAGRHAVQYLARLELIFIFVRFNYSQLARE